MPWEPSSLAPAGDLAPATAAGAGGAPADAAAETPGRRFVAAYCRVCGWVRPALTSTAPDGALQAVCLECGAAVASEALAGAKPQAVAPTAPTLLLFLASRPAEHDAELVADLRRPATAAFAPISTQGLRLAAAGWRATWRRLRAWELFEVWWGGILPALIFGLMASYQYAHGRSFAGISGPIFLAGYPLFMLLLWRVWKRSRADHWLQQTHLHWARNLSRPLTLEQLAAAVEFHRYDAGFAARLSRLSFDPDLPDVDPPTLASLRPPDRNDWAQRWEKALCTLRQAPPATEQSAPSTPNPIPAQNVGEGDSAAPVAATEMAPALATPSPGPTSIPATGAPQEPAATAPDPLPPAVVAAATQAPPTQDGLEPSATAPQAGEAPPPEAQRQEPAAENMRREASPPPPPPPSPPPPPAVPPDQNLDDYRRAVNQYITAGRALTAKPRGTPRARRLRAGLALATSLVLALMIVRNLRRDVELYLVNTDDQTVRLYVDGEHRSTLEPGTVEHFFVRESGHHLIELRAIDDTPLWRRALNLEQGSYAINPSYQTCQFIWHEFQAGNVHTMTTLLGDSGHALVKLPGSPDLGPNELFTDSASPVQAAAGQFTWLELRRKGDMPFGEATPPPRDPNDHDYWSDKDGLHF